MVLYLSASLRIGVKSSVEARERNERFDFRAKKKSPRVSCRNLQIAATYGPKHPIFLKALSQLVEALRAPGLESKLKSTRSATRLPSKGIG